MNKFLDFIAMTKLGYMIFILFFISIISIFVAFYSTEMIPWLFIGTIPVITFNLLTKHKKMPWFNPYKKLK